MSRLLTEGVWAESAVGVVRVDTTLSLLPLHVRGGQVTPLQQPAVNTKITFKTVKFFWFDPSPPQR